MSLYNFMYLGPFIIINIPFKTEMAVDHYKCPICNRKINDKFCSKDGAEGITNLKTIEVDATSDENYQFLAKNIFNTFQNVGPFVGDGKAHILIDYDYDTLDEESYTEISDISNILLEFKDKHSQLIKDIYFRFGESNVKIIYGFVNWKS